jgi:hypothetical protein
MTWIVPKLLISRFAPAMEELISDCAAASQTCEQSLMRRSKPSRANSFLREWKQGNLMRLRSGLISSDSLGKSFEDWWTSYLVGIRASHFPAQESDLEGKTRDTFGRLSQAAFDFFNQESASLKTSRATLPKGCITSCLTWEDWVTEQRGEFSARVNAVHRINGNESSSWPTVRTNDSQAGRPNDGVSRIGSNGQRFGINLADKVLAEKQWPTASARDWKGAPKSRVTLEGYNARLDEAVILFGPVDPINPSTNGSRQGWSEIDPQFWGTPRASERGDCPSEKLRDNPDLRAQVVIAQSWATPRSGKTTDENPETWAKRQAQGQVATMPLTAQVKQEQWPTATVSTGAHRQKDGSMIPKLDTQVGGKLNPRWVETLMGLPVGWTMPSCTSPRTIAPTSCGSLGTESCQPQQSELSKS